MPISLEALAQQCSPSIAVETMAALVTHESGGNPFAIGVNGSVRISRQPIDRTEAIETAKRLLNFATSVDLGLAQINSRNLSSLGLSIEEVFEPCVNLRAAETILRRCYDPVAQRLGSGQPALQAALSCYNTGGYSGGLATGYVKAVYRAAKTAP